MNSASGSRNDCLTFTVLDFQILLSSSLSFVTLPFPHCEIFFCFVINFQSQYFTMVVRKLELYLTNHCFSAQTYQYFEKFEER